MPSHRWPTGTEFTRRVLEPDATCPRCADTDLVVCDHRHRYLQSFEGPLHLVCKLAHCRNAACPTRGHTISPSSELTIAPPRLLVGWGVFAWIGHRRIAKDWRVPQIREELRDAHRITGRALPLHAVPPRHDVDPCLDEALTRAASGPATARNGRRDLPPRRGCRLHDVRHEEGERSRRPFLDDGTAVIHEMPQVGDVGSGVHVVLGIWRSEGAVRDGLLGQRRARREGRG